MTHLDDHDYDDYTISNVLETDTGYVLTLDLRQAPYAQFRRMFALNKIYDYIPHEGQRFRRYGRAGIRGAQIGSTLLFYRSPEDFARIQSLWLDYQTYHQRRFATETEER